VRFSIRYNRDRQMRGYRNCVFEVEARGVAEEMASNYPLTK
jgi:hypothetical protein